MKRYVMILLGVIYRFFICNAQPGALDLSFIPGIGANNTIFCTAVQGDGKIIAGGAFSSFNGMSVNGIVRLHSNGTIDSTFVTGTGASAAVIACAIQTDGRIIIGGGFTSCNGVAVNYIARLNTDGSLDTTFNPGTGPNDAVHALAIQSDGKILIGGLFTSCNGTSCGRIIRLDTLGAVDAGFNPGAGANGSVEAIAIQTNGKILIGGSFTVYGTNTALRVARINTDGSTDTGFNPPFGGGGASSNVFAIAVQGDGKILLGGDFITYNLSPSNRLLRLLPGGNLDNFFAAGLGANSTVTSLCLQGNGEVVFGGSFTSYNGTGVNRIMQVSALGSSDTSFKPGTAADGTIFSVSIQSNGKILIGGSFQNYNGISRNCIARLFSCTIPQPGPISGDTLYTCPGNRLTYSISPVSGANRYSWSLPPGWSGSSDSTSIHVTASDSSGIISVVAVSDSCGNSTPQTLYVARVPVPSIPLCLVTVDSQSLYNIIIWEKPQTRLIDSFYLYRENTLNVFTKIASIPFDSLSEYVDTDTTNANPNATAHKYKISVLDSCGLESALSDYHNTIFLQDLGNGNLQWTLYGIENAGNPVTFYRVYRDDLGNGNFAPLNTTIPGGNFNFTDVNASSFPNARYVLDVTWSISCNPTRAVNTTRSNIKKKKSHTNSISETSPDLNREFELYPNPAGSSIMLRYPANIQVEDLGIFDLLGQSVYREIPGIQTGQQLKTINLETLTPGVYSLKAETNCGRIIKKLIIQ